MALARELDGEALVGLRVLELGCGLALPSLTAARAGATVLATDASAEALTLVARNAGANGLRVETAAVEWSDPDELRRRGPFDLVLAADVLYEQDNAAPLLSLLPQLAPEAWIADPGPAGGRRVRRAGAPLGGRDERAGRFGYTGADRLTRQSPRAPAQR